jgi:hypothetical protein
VNRSFQFRDAAEGSAADPLAGDLGKQRSIWFNQEAPVGVKCT